MLKLDCLVCKKEFPVEEMYSVDACCEEHQIKLDNNYCDKGHRLAFSIGVGYWRTECDCGLFDVSMNAETGRLILRKKKAVEM